MIYLITGTPGTGKTAFAVSSIINNREGLFKYETEDGETVDRPLYFCHIDGLDEKALKAHRLTEEQIQSAPLNELVPKGSVVIVDEADYAYPTRAAAKEVPPYVKTLKELRHDGFTLILMTQHPSMLDSYLRNLVGKHWHLERKQVGTKLYEFYRCETNIASACAAKGVTSDFYKPDKRAFKYYKSASIHIKFKKKLHPVFYGMGLLLVCAPLFFYYSSGRFKRYVGAEEQPAAVAIAETSAPAQQQAAADNYSAAPPVAASMPIGAKVEDYRPRIANLQETAPIYDSLRQVADFPRRVACVASADSCNCYSQQATILPNISTAECRAIVKQRPFDPYRKIETQRAETTVSAPPSEPQVLALEGSSKPNLSYSELPNMAQ
ncbi:zonular occludens toxin domain-containing protein [Eikenella corrodens]|uniref:zonular occludens toxin domain-containing protein n=1 Tax=Eikenella corrodens TaxID=539 RepID=UPI00129BBBDC|nr:zonular occludens toxin domain-containing protein [Eikenella corrodens]